MKKIISAILVVMLVFGMLPVFAMAAETTATLSFASTAQRVSQDANAQVWANEGITFTNNKGKSTTNVADYYNPVRLYANSNFVIEYPGMTKIEFVSDGTAKYIAALTGATFSAGTLSANGANITLTFSAPTDSVTVTVSAQARLKSLTVTAVESNGDAPCVHTNTTTIPGAAATCTEAGLSEGTVCADCGFVVTAQTEIPALGHSYDEDGECVECGKIKGDVQPVATITFDDAAKRTVGGNEQQVWVENEIIFTNNKAASTSNVNISYVAPVRLYKNSDIIIEYPGMGKIEFACNTEDYATALESSLTDGTYASAVVSGKIVTVIFDTAVDSYTITLSGGQVRMDSLTVTVKVEGCEHTPVAQDDAIAPTCAAVGYTATEKCSKCGETTKYAEEIPALGHSYVDGYCDVCKGWAADSTLTIPQATALGLSKAHNTYTSDKYYMTVVIVNVYQTSYGNMNVTDAEGNEFVVYGTYSADGKTSYGQLSDKPVAGDTITVYGIIGQYNGTAQMKNGWIIKIETPVCEHTETTELADGKEPTCTETGLTKTVVCAACGEIVTAQTEIPAYGHAWVEQEAFAPTCIHTGHLTHFECCVCLVVSLDKETLNTKEEVQLPINPDAHAWDEGVYTEPTTEADGYTTYTCGNCGATEVEVDEGTMLVPVPTITAQPAAVTVNSGEIAQFTVAVTGGEVVSYKWEYRAIWKWFNTTMTGYDTDTLSVTATGARNGYDYRCTITFADGTVLTTEPAEMTVNTVINILDNPNNQLVALGYKGQFTVLAEGEGLKYQWQYQRPDGERWIETEMEGSTKPTVFIETTTARDGYKYRCMITDAAGTVAYSEYATMTVLYCAAQPTDVRTSAGQNVTFSVETNETPVRYEWEYSKNGTTWYPTSMTGYNTATLTVAATTARNGYQYRCVITGGKDSKLISKVATLYVGSAAEITSQPEDATAAAGATATFTVAATNVLNYQWQYTKNGTEWFTTTMTGAKTATLEVAATSGRNGYQYRCMITGENGDVIYTNAVTLTVE